MKTKREVREGVIAGGLGTARPDVSARNRSSLIPHRSSLMPHRSSGYILLELVIALTMFSIAVLGLARTLGTTIEIANILNRDNLLRVGMRSFLEEVRRKPLAELNMTFVDTSTGITYTSTAERVSLTRSDGNLLSDLYDLKVVANYSVGAELREEMVSVYVYKPAQR